MQIAATLEFARTIDPCQIYFHKFAFVDKYLKTAKFLFNIDLL